jgi:hypothetical protein
MLSLHCFFDCHAHHESQIKLLLSQDAYLTIQQLARLWLQHLLLKCLYQYQNKVSLLMVVLLVRQVLDFLLRFDYRQ